MSLKRFSGALVCVWFQGDVKMGLVLLGAAALAAATNARAQAGDLCTNTLQFEVFGSLLSTFSSISPLSAGSSYQLAFCARGDLIISDGSTEHLLSSGSCSVSTAPAIIAPGVVVGSHGVPSHGL